MTEYPTIDSCDLCVTATSVTIGQTPIHAAGPVGTFHSLLGEPTRIIPAGPPAPFGHRNNHIHFYDHLGLRLNEHHYTHQIQAVTAVLNTVDSIHPTRLPFSGTLQVGGVNIGEGEVETKLAESAIPFVSRLPGIWAADVTSAPTEGHRIHISVDTKGRMLPSGRRSRKREILSVELSLHHDPWDTSHKPS